MELVASEMAAFKHLALSIPHACNIGLQARGAANGVAVYFEHGCKRHRVFGGVKVTHVGQQKLERITYTPVGIHHTRQNFVVDV